MNLITGKAKEAFDIYLFNSTEYLYSEITTLDERTILPLIIDWLDSVGIYVIPRKLKCDVYPWSFNINDSIYLGIVNKFETRHQATQEAIKQAVEMYNKGAN